MNCVPKFCMSLSSVFIPGRLRTECDRHQCTAISHQHTPRNYLVKDCKGLYSTYPGTTDEIHYATSNVVLIACSLSRYLVKE